MINSMTFVTIEKWLTKQEGIKRALKKIEEDSTFENFKFSGALYNPRSGKVIFLEENGVTK